MITKEITEKQFKGMLRNHDWYYGKSNDNRIFNKGNMNELIAELKSILYKAKNPTMDNGHQINFNDLNRLLTKVIIRSEDLLKQNEELKINYII